MNDGAPDASKWLGLDRSSFVATACVEQGQMLRVRNDADGLQDHLQRAAATAGTAATAAKALGRIDECLRERVGRDQANSTKPLRTAHLNVQHAQRVLEERDRPTRSTYPALHGLRSYAMRRRQRPRQSAPRRRRLLSSRRPNRRSGHHELESCMTNTALRRRPRRSTTMLSRGKSPKL